MKTRALHRMFAALMVGLFSVPAVAQFTRDASALKKIDEAVNTHYLMMQLDKAESLLTGTLDACADKCSPATKAKAWMYVGIVRGSGKNDQAGAGQAFSTAKGIDPGVALDRELATPETQSTFDGTAGGSGSVVVAAPVAQAAPAAGAPGAAPPPVGVPGDMLCSPQGATIQTRMPIPFSCSSNASVAEGFIKFQEPGASDWKKVSLSNMNGQWQAEIPCTFTGKEGQLKFYVGVKDGAGEFVDQFGSKTAPATIDLAEMGAAPAFPGMPAVTRCAAADGASDCPPDFPGCSSSSDTKTCGDLDWGASCNNSTECKCGLLCESGQCATAPKCSTDAECSTGTCVDGACSALAGGEEGSGAGQFSKHWLSFGAGMDYMMLGGNNLCSANEDFETSYGIQCYDAAGARSEPENVNIGSGAAPGQIRIKVGYDYAFTDKISLGLRAGFAFMNTHPAAGEKGFLPVHIEARGTYNFTSLTKKGLRPSVYVAGGLAEVDGHLTAGTTEIYKLAGYTFFAPGGSLGYMFAPNMGLNLDVQLMLLIPNGGFTPAIHPALNFVYGL